MTANETDTDLDRPWTCRLAGRSYEIAAAPGVRARVVLRVNDVVVRESTSADDHRKIPLGDGRRVEVWLSARGRIKRATAYDGGVDLDFDAPKGSRAARTQAWGREHPSLFALRHVAIKGGGIVIALLGLGAILKTIVAPVIRWIAERLPPMPDIDLPDIPWPRIPWPDIRLPRIPWPDVVPPGWLLALLDRLEQYEDIIKPLLIGVVIALAEMRRQRRQKRLRESGAASPPSQADAPDDDVPSDGEAGSSSASSRSTPPPTPLPAEETTHPPGSRSGAS